MTLNYKACRLMLITAPRSFPKFEDSIEIIFESHHYDNDPLLERQSKRPFTFT